MTQHQWKLLMVYNLPFLLVLGAVFFRGWGGFLGVLDSFLNGEHRAMQKGSVRELFWGEHVWAQLLIMGWLISYSLLVAAEGWLLHRFGIL